MSASILIVDDEEIACKHFGEYLLLNGHEVETTATLVEARQVIQQGKADIIVLDVNLKGEYGPDLLTETATMPNRPPIILVTGEGEIEMAVDAMKNGAHDFFVKPVKLNQLKESIQRAEEMVLMRRELEHLRRQQTQAVDMIVGNSPQMKQLINMAHRAAEACVSVIITGETGTGKDVLASAIHQMGPRAKKPYIAINCAALPNTTLESELFGHEKGAFTDADKRKPGLMEIANEGILFLDEISSMSLGAQAKILRAVENQTFRRMGGTQEIKVDVQILAATNRPLSEMISKGEFRSDLFHRLSVLRLEVPPLRERKEDIPSFVGRFLNTHKQRMGRAIDGITQRALDALQAYSWPGNIRELDHVIEHAVLLCDDPNIDLAHLPPEVLHEWGALKDQ